jgi:asparagine synthase (glutamine-hydrolysing)
MCGIAGVLRFDRRSPSRHALEAMGGRLRHRGPDGLGFYAPDDQPVGLAHTRLSVIDLATGDQPMFGGGKRHVLIFNGEIYNFRELRPKLERQGHSFRTTSDTEVILAAYAEWGEDFVDHVDGMFAIAIWDSERQRLVLARDRVGKKPLFLYRDDRILAFASEIKALLELPEVTATLDPSAIPLYLTFGYVPTPRTFYSEIVKLEPATVMSVGVDGSTRKRCYWSVRFGVASSTMTDATATLRLQELMNAAVERRMVADVPLGAFLSGGLDSNIVVALMSRMSDRPVKTFSIGFGDAEYDETAVARRAAAHYGADHTEFIVEPDAMDLYDELVAAYDEPFGDSSALPTSIVSKLARSNVTVALTGDGGDELFAGYLRLHAAALSEHVPRVVRRGGRALSSLIPSNGSSRGLAARAARYLRAASDPLAQRYLRWVGVLPEEAGTLLRPEVMAAHFDPGAAVASFDQILGEGRSASPLGRLMTLNFHTYLLDDLLVKADRCSMLHALELRSPFLDTELIEFAAALPERLLFRRGVTKRILRESFADMLPPEVVAQAKKGFGVPLDRWFRTRWRGLLAERLLQKDSALMEWLDPTAVRRVVDEHLSGSRNRGQQLWALLTLDCWLEANRARRTAVPAIV